MILLGASPDDYKLRFEEVRPVPVWRQLCPPASLLPPLRPHWPLLSPRLLTHGPPFPQLYLRVTKHELVLDRLMAAESFFLSSLDDNYFVFQDTMLCILTIFLRDDSVAYYLGCGQNVAGGERAFLPRPKRSFAPSAALSSLNPVPTSDDDDDDSAVESNGVCRPVGDGCQISPPRSSRHCFRPRRPQA